VKDLSNKEVVFELDKPRVSEHLSGSSHGAFSYADYERALRLIDSINVCISEVTAQAGLKFINLGIGTAKDAGAWIDRFLPDGSYEYFVDFHYLMEQCHWRTKEEKSLEQMT
jgi:hypothetical protein